MGLFFLIVGGALVVWGLLQVVSMLIFLFWVQHWGSRWERRARLPLLLFLPALHTIDPMDRLARRFRFAPRRFRTSPRLLWWLGGIFSALGLLLSALIR